MGGLINDKKNPVQPRLNSYGRKAPVVSIIVTGQGGWDDVERTLSTVYTQSISNLETIVFDDATAGKAGQDILKRWPETTVLRSDKRLGFCRAKNIAAERATGAYLLFLEGETWLNEDTIRKLIETIEAESEIGVVGPLILNADKSLKSIGMKIDQLGHPVVRKDIFKPDEDIVENVFFVPGSAMLIERDLFLSLNGFDQHYFAGLEDADICWRAKLLGRKIVVNPWSIAYCDTGRRERADTYSRHRDSLRMIIKNYGLILAVVSVFRFVYATVAESFKSLLLLRPYLFTQYWRALIWNLFMLPNSIKQRRRVQKDRRQDDKIVLKDVLIETEEFSSFTSDRAA